MNKQIFRDAFIAKLSGIAEYKNEKEIWWEEDHGEDGVETVTIEFLAESSEHVMVRSYYKSGNIYYQNEWKDGKLNGLATHYHSDGSICCKAIYADGIRKTELNP